MKIFRAPGGGGTSAEYIYWKRLPLEHGSDRPQTLGKRVSDDLQLLIFRRRKQNFDEKFRFGNMFFVIFGGFWRS